MARDLPAGTVTFLFTDIEGSTRLLHELGDSYADVLSGHRRILRRAFDDHGGEEVDTQGDSFFVAFDDPARAVAAAAASQVALDAERWPAGVAVRVRMGVHTGDPLLAEGHYVGIDVHRAARIAAAAHGGQVLVSERTSRLLSENGSPALRSLGDHRLKDLPEPERLFQLLVDGLPSSFPPPRVHEDALAAAGLPDYSLPPADVPCPYKGLAAFQPEDSELFFGREPLVADLVARLDAAPFLAVVGPSGSGKSSLVRAGLVPAVEQRAGAELRTVILSPGASPVAELDSAREARLVIVDQFEELFTLCREDEQRTAFVDALLDRATDGVRVVIVLRADFYGHCAGLPRLAAQLEQRQALVGPITEEELRRAIEQPAHGAGLVLEPGVVEGILRDVVGEPGALPLLSHSLLETWRRRSGPMLTLLGYLQSGGVRGAIAQTAETVYHDALSRDEQVLARNIFLRLTELGEGTEDTRRRVSVSELTPRAGQEADVAEVLQRLSDARLVTIGDRTVEVAHEALIRHWPTLRSWLDEDREGRIAHRRLTEAAQEWEALARDPGALLRGARLATTGDWATAHDAELNDLERDYLTASRQAAQREAERQRRANRRLRALLAGALVLLAAALLAGVLALLQQRRAEDAADAANAQRLGALALVEKRPDTAVLLALEATRFGASPETKGALFDTLMKYGHVLRVARTDERVLRMAAPTTGGGPVAVSDNSGHLTLYDPSTLARRREVTLPFTVDLAYAPDGRAVYAAGLVGDDPRAQAIRAVDPASGSVLWTRPVPLGDRGLSVTRDGRHIAWSADKVFVLLDSRTGNEVARLPIAPGSKTVPLPDGRALVLRGRSATIVDMSSKHPVRRLQLPAVEVAALAVTTDGSRVAIGHEDGTVAVVGLDTGRIVPMREPHEGFVESVAFSPDGTRLATAGDNDGRVLVWNPSTGERVDVLTGHGAGLRAIAFADAGRTLVSSGLDSTLIAWDVANDRAMLRSFDVPGPPCHEGAGCFFPLFSVSRDGSTLAILGADSRVRFVDGERLRPAGALMARALACCQEPAFSADGRTLATAWIEPMGISLWDTGTGRLTRRLFSSDEPWPNRREHAPPLDTVAYAPDGSSVATNENNDVLLLDPASGARRARLHAPEFVEWLTYSPDSRLLEAATDNGGVTVWDLRSKKRLWSRRIDNQSTLGGAFSPDGDLLLVGGESGRIHLLEARTGEPVRAPLLAHSAYLGSLAFARDGSFFASSGMDGRTILWDTASERALGSPFDAGTPTWTHFSPDGKTLYVVSYERGYAFDASLDTWGERACSVAGRPLTRAEWTRFMGGRRYDPACADTH